MRPLLASLSALALAACAVGPDHVAPPVPSATASGPFLSQSAAVSTAPVEGEWWRLYRDPVLDGLVADALKANTDVRQAVERLARARALLREAGADRLPDTTIAASGVRTRQPALQSLPGIDRELTRIDTGLDISYEVDLFGRVGRSIEAARGDVGAAAGDLDAVRVMVAAETARAYADAAAAAERIAVAERIVALLDRSLRVTAGRERVGLTTGLDTARIAGLRDQRRAELPSLNAERQAALFRLAVLTGRAPSDLPRVAATRTTTLRLDQPIPVGDGAALIARRPDIRAAERRLAAATARIGVETAELYPSIRLGGSIGSTGTGFADFFGAGPLRWLLGPLINWTFPNQTRARARIAAAEAGSREALAAFDGTVLTALRETETALAVYAGRIERRAALQAARDQAERAARIVRAQQREGTVDSLALLDAERSFADAEAGLALADAQIADAQVDLFRALGGGWDETPG